MMAAVNRQRGLKCLVTAVGRLPAQRRELMSIVPTRSLDLVATRGLNLLPTRRLDLLPARSLHLIVRASPCRRCGDEQSRQGHHQNPFRENHALTSLLFTSRPLAAHP